MQSRRIVSGIIGIMLVAAAIYALSTVPGMNDKLNESVTYIENEVKDLSDMVSDEKSDSNDSAEEDLSQEDEVLDSSVQNTSEKYDIFSIHGSEVTNG
jgi:hypothetical protein